MSLKTKNIIIFLSIILLVYFSVAENASAEILFEDNFDGYIDSPTNHGWIIPTAANMESCDSPDGGRCLKFTIQEAGTSQYWSNFDPNPSGTFEDGYIAFWAKQEGHIDDTSGGVKWLKLFSADYSETYANVTWGQTYQSGQFGSVNTGDGYGIRNDTNVGYRYGGLVSAGTWVAGNVYAAGYTSGYGTNKIYTCKLDHTASADNRPGIGPDWNTYWDLVGTVSEFSASFYSGEGWHFYEYYMKHNTDNNFDGEFASWIDGQLKIRVTGMRNRNNINSMDWDSASLVNHVEIAAPSEYYIYFDKIITSDNYIEYIAPGFDTTAPTAPGGLAVN